MTDKEQIIKYLEENNVSGEDFNLLLMKYLSENEFDYDKYSILVNYYLLMQDIEKAKEYAQQAQMVNPYCVEANYNLAEVYYIDNDYYNALKYYLRTECLITNMGSDSVIDMDLLHAAIEDCKPHLSIKEIEILYYLIINATKSPMDIGDNYIDELYNTAYIGLYDDWLRSNWGDEREYSGYPMHELFWTENVGTACRFQETGDYIVPIVGMPYKREGVNWLRIDEKDQKKSSTVGIVNAKTYSYFRISGRADIASANPVVFGKPIHLKHHKNNKKLVVCLFIDSFNYRIFELAGKGNGSLEGIKKLMPYTYELFSDGIICTNAYSDSEWTTPSLPSYWTGIYSHHHMIVDDDVRWPLPEYVKILPEYFKDAGYMTVRLGENQGPTSPGYGFLRGTDRHVSISGHHDPGKFIVEVIDQIEAFNECDQFIWISFEDLHRIAGNFDCDISVQTHTPVSKRVPDNDGATTIKQSRSQNKQFAYEKAIQRLDRVFEILYSYIRTHYDEGEYVVSLFSDHGTAFIVDDDQPFICAQRTNVPMMFYSGDKKGVCEEFVQNIDYAGMLCKLAGVKYDYKDRDAILPIFFGGEKEREYVLSQTIFKGDSYQAMIKSKEFTYYYTSEDKLSGEFRLKDNKSTSVLLNTDGKPANDFDEEKRLKQIIEENIYFMFKERLQ